MATTKEILGFAVEIADQMLRNGAEIYRVEDTVIYILRAHQITNFDVYVLSNGIFASADEDTEEACSVIRHVSFGGVHLERLSVLNQIARDVCAHRLTIEEGWERMREAKKIPEFPLRLQYLMCGIGSAGFAYMFGGTILDALCAFFVGTLEQMLLSACGRRKLSKFVKVILAGAFVAFSTNLLMRAGIPIRENLVIIGSTMVIFPGIAFTTGIRDLYNSDYLSGVIHLFDAVLTAVCIAVGSCMPLILQNLLYRI